MTFMEVVLDVAAALAVLAAIVYCLCVVVGWARRRQKRAYAIGAALAPFMALGNVADPDYRIVHESKQHKKREEGGPGDPPNGEDADSLAAVRQPAPTAKPPVTRVLAALRPRIRQTFA